jgi:branched-chain amino acid transport system permease protein
MNQVVLNGLTGLGNGVLIAAVAISLVVFYRGSGVINLAAGAVSMVTGFTFWTLRGGSSGLGSATGIVDLSTVPALVLALLAAAGMGLCFEFAVFRPLRTAPPLAKVVGTIGVLLAAQAGMLLAFGETTQTEPAILPQTEVTMLGGTVPLYSLLLAGIVVVVAGTLALVYRSTRFGLATRAAAENQVAATLVGLSPGWLSTVNAVMACVVAGGLGVLAAPAVGLDTQTLPLIVVPALAAALLAAFESVMAACLVGLAIGVGESLVAYASVQSWFPSDGPGTPLPGVQDVLIFLVIAATLRWRGASLPERGDPVERRLAIAPRPRRLLRPALIAVVLGVSALIFLPWDFRSALMNSMIGAILVLSLVLVTGFVGQISVMQLALSGAAGLVVSHLALQAGIGFPFGVIIGAIAATVLGLVTAVSALRIRGVSLLVLTLAAAVALQNFVFGNQTWGAGGISGAAVPQPSLMGLNLGNAAPFRGLDGLLPSPMLGFVILAFTVALCLLVANIRSGGLGQRMLALRSNERAAAAVGVSVRNVKLTAFGIGAFIAGVAGALYGYDFSGISTDRFTASTALSLIAFAYIGGITMVSGALLAGLLAVEGVAQYALQKWFGLNGTWAVMFGGITLIASVIFAPGGWAGAMHARKQRRRQMSAAGARERNLIGAIAAPSGSPERPAARR